MNTAQTTNDLGAAAARRTLDDFGDVLSRADVLQLFQMPNVQSLYRRIQALTFPAPSLRRPMRWFKTDLSRWMHGDPRRRQRGLA